VKEATRQWLVLIAVVIALIGVGAGYVFVNFSWEASPSAENYVDQRTRLAVVQGAAGFTTLLAPVVSVALALLVAR
jgi:hypothetical protein